MKKISEDFVNGINLSQLIQQLNNVNLSQECISVKNKGDDIELIFADIITEDDQILIDTVISNHVPDNAKPRRKSFNINLGEKYMIYDSYTLISRFTYQGSQAIGVIDYIDIISHIQNPSATYDVKIVKFPNMEKIAEKTGLNNSETMTFDLGPITNLSEDSSILEIFVRKIGGNDQDVLYVNEIVVYHGN